MNNSNYGTGYVLGISRGHNAGACLLKDGEIVFAIEEERLTRQKYDGGPASSILKVLEYTDRIDYMFVSHTQKLAHNVIEFTGDPLWSGLARKLGLIQNKVPDLRDHPQYCDLSKQHHKIHAACAFYRSGFDEAVAVVVDGAGTGEDRVYETGEKVVLWEVETIINCDYPAKFQTLYKHQGSTDIRGTYINKERPCNELGLEPEGTTFESIISDRAGITKAYEAVTEYCGFSGIEAGKTMGLFPYGEFNPDLPNLFLPDSEYPLVDRNVIFPSYPGTAVVNAHLYPALNDRFYIGPNIVGNGGPAIHPEGKDVSLEQIRRDLAWKLQTETQQQVLNLILKAVEMSGRKKVVLSGGYGLNCVANYFYLNELKKHGIELYVEPISNDGGTAIGAALWGWHVLTESTENKANRSVYLGPSYTLDDDYIESLADSHNMDCEDCDDAKVVELMTSKNIVGVWQGRSENGPRALGNRSLLFDPRFEDGKDFVNLVKRREYFRPFAGSILQEDVHDWFDLRGMDDSPHMMYAVHCKEGVAEKIPSIIHVDGSCRIQTVSQEDNPLYYRLISEFKEQTGVPIVFNTSFNLGGEPLVETLWDCVWTLLNSDIEYLYLPEYGKLITCKNNNE